MGSRGAATLMIWLLEEVDALSSVFFTLNDSMDTKPRTRPQLPDATCLSSPSRVIATQLCDYLPPCSKGPKLQHSGLIRLSQELNRLRFSISLRTEGFEFASDEVSASGDRSYFWMESGVLWKADGGAARGGSDGSEDWAS